ncbi:hypothetical protein V6N12_022184 [Hibiscus sabdariffa]|uniref:Uncharacterized protein n=1 Tax=Hibiscus sabdariffa TaxID=183260 RepID=A0ABR2FUR0_9ROSI
MAGIPRLVKVDSVAVVVPQIEFDHGGELGKSQPATPVRVFQLSKFLSAAVFSAVLAAAPLSQRRMNQ